MGIALFVGRSAERCVCLGGVCGSHQIALYIKALIHISWALSFLVLNQKLNFQNESPKNSSCSGFWELNPNETRIFPLILEILSSWKEDFPKLPDNQ